MGKKKREKRIKEENKKNMEQVERENRKQSNKQHIANMQAALVVKIIM